MTHLDISLLGPLEVTLNGQPADGFLSDKVRALLAYLVSEQPRSFRREALAGLLWPDQPEAKARANLRRALANLRQVLAVAGDRCLRITRQSLQFQLDDTVEVDSVRFQTLSAGERSLAELATAVGLVNGRFMEGFSLRDCVAFEEWLLLQREQVQRQHVVALDRLARAYEARYQYDEALKVAWQMAALEPWQESGRRLVMRLLALTGQRAAALSHFDQYRRELAAELAVSPEPETIKLQREIRAGEVGGSDEVLPRFLRETAPRPAQTTPFVGRERACAQLHDYLQTAVVGRRPIAFVTGGAGSGKSTLLHAFARQAQTEIPALLPLIGECQPNVGGGDPYQPFRMALSLLAADIEPHWQAGQLDRAQAARLWAVRKQARLLLQETAPGLIGPLIEPSLLAEEQPTAGRDTPRQALLFATLARFLQQLTRIGPVLLLLDDLQWADRASLDLLFHLGRSLSGFPLLLLASYRPEEVRRGDALRLFAQEIAKTYGPCTVALNRAAGRQFVDRYLDSEPNRLNQAFRTRLFRQTRGHALFTVELVRALQANGELVRDRAGYWRCRADVSWDLVPARVEAVIGEQIDQLTPQQVELLAAAGVQGESFLAEVVAGCLDLPVAAVVHEMSQVLARRFRLVRPVGQLQLGERQVSRYRFRHQLFQTVLLSRLDAIELATLHARIGLQMEQLYEAARAETTAVSAQLAGHFEAAGQLDKARHYRLLAGRRALQLSANQEAVTHFRRALSHLMQTPSSSQRQRQELDILLALGTAQLASDGYSAPAVRAIYDRARTLSRELRSTPEHLTALFWLTSYYCVSGQLPVALEIAAQMQALAEAVELDAPRQMMVHLMTGIPLFFSGCLAQARHYFQQVTALCGPLPDPDVILSLGQDPGLAGRMWLAHVLLHQGQTQPAQMHLQAVLAQAKTLQHPYSETFLLLLSGCTPNLFYMDKLDTAEFYARAALAAAVEGGFVLLQTLARFYLGYILFQLAANEAGQVNGMEMMEAALQAEAELGSQLGVTSRQLLLADCYHRAGRGDAAWQSLTAVEASLLSNGERYFESELYRVKSRLLQAEDEMAAEAALKLALIVARQQGADLWVERLTEDLRCLGQHRYVSESSLAIMEVSESASV